MVQIHSYMNVTNHIQFNASVYYASAIGAGVFAPPGSSGDPDFSRADFNIVWNPKPGLDLAVGVQNAFDPQHEEAPLGYTSTAEVRRAVYGQITWNY
jgi:hypothetical protein